jgi:hypothetical protein
MMLGGPARKFLRKKDLGGHRLHDEPVERVADALHPHTDPGKQHILN